MTASYQQQLLNPGVWVPRKVTCPRICSHPYFFQVRIGKRPGSSLSTFQRLRLGPLPLDYACVTVSKGKLRVIAMTTGRNIAPSLTRIGKINRKIAVIYAVFRRRSRIRLLFNEKYRGGRIRIADIRKSEIFHNPLMRGVPTSEGGTIIPHHAAQRIAAGPRQVLAQYIHIVRGATVAVYVGGIGKK